GAERFEPAEKKTTSLAVTRLRSYLERRGVAADFATPTVVVWPSNTRERLSLALLRRVGDSPVVGGDAFRWAVRSMTSTRGLLRRQKTADPELVTALSELLVAAASSRVSTTGDMQVSVVTGASGFVDAPAPFVQLESDPFGDSGDDGSVEC
ncbi:MAG TPA: hypothetical protein VIT42_07805, partial [Microlunatus sp.]